jgi:hypothetical protein
MKILRESNTKKFIAWDRCVVVSRPKTTYVNQLVKFASRVNIQKIYINFYSQLHPPQQFPSLSHAHDPPQHVSVPD